MLNKELSTINNEDIDYIKSEYNKHKNLRKTRDIVNRVLDLNLTIYNIKKLIGEIGEDIDGLKELNEDIGGEKNYEVENNHYIFYSKETDEYGEKYYKKYPISIKIVNEIFYDYSRHGNNLSGEEIRTKYNLEDKVFNLIKSRLRLYKASHVVSPYTLENSSEEELQQIIDGAIDSHINDRYKKRFKETFEKKREEDYVLKSRKLASEESRLEYFKSYLDTYTPRKFESLRPKNTQTNNKEITVMFSDIHLGKMNSDEVEQRIIKMTSNIISRPETIVNLVCLGDLVETLAKGGMHPGQIESMDGLYGFELFMKAVCIIEEMLVRLHNEGKEVRFYGLGGNHDRFTSKEEDGFFGMSAELMYEMIRRGVENLGIEINMLRERWQNREIDGMNFILNHGYKRDTGKHSGNILWELGKKGMVNIIAQGDKHHTEVIDPSNDAIRVIVPGLAGANQYDKSLLLSSFPGYMIIEKDEEGNPTQTIFRFNK